jgi:Rrf2 family protein
MPTLGTNVEHAIHALIYLCAVPHGTVITVKDLSKYQDVSESYLAKAFTSLKKAGIVRSNIGVKGGYALSRAPAEISFLDIALAIEGEISFFQCNGIREKCILVDQDDRPWEKGDVCTIHLVMMEIENKIRDSLKAKSLEWLFRTVKEGTMPGIMKEPRDW